MWRQKAEDAAIPGQIPVPDPVRPIVAQHEESTAAGRAGAMGSSHACIGKGITVRGEITGTDSLHVEGTVEGTIHIPGERVSIGREGRVIAPKGAAPCVRAREIVVLGSVTGNIEAEDRVEMRAQASLAGDISTRRVSIEDGAYFRGGIDIRREAPAAEAADAARISTAESAAEPVHA